MNAADAEAFLARSLADRKLSGSEKQALAAWLDANARTDQQKGVVRHAAFELARQSVADPDAAKVIAWLEDVMRPIAPVIQQNATASPSSATDTAFFTPGDACWQHIVHRLHTARKTADLCVFTITDDRISRAVVEAHRRGVRLRIFSDAEKAHDLGSDMRQFADEGIAVKLVRVVAHADPGVSGHMHHKFAIFDGTRLLNGSYNWTRGAANVNYEDLIDTAEAPLVAAFAAEFERLWNKS
jgi:phosphatidylserine/phosphatidylglycerophosphate/cardiolipin synthase-like enzyme